MNTSLVNYYEVLLEIITSLRFIIVVTFSKNLNHPETVHFIQVHAESSYYQIPIFNKQYQKKSEENEKENLWRINPTGERYLK